MTDLGDTTHPTRATWLRVKSIVGEAVEHAPAERAAVVDRLCGSDGVVRAQVESLLAAHDLAEKESGSAGPTIQVPPAGGVSDHAPGDSIGRYKLLERIGEGGFGAVFVAEQTEPIRRRVALKIVKLGMDTRAVVARFEAERQALALMDHPGIARVLDAGATPTGRPYFVMELVKGRPITDYCDAEDLSIPARLRLMLCVCRAVQHAHQKGVIHRDLKPSNVLVTLTDGEPTPKVIDFGIAKAFAGSLTNRTVYTEFRQFVGTPEFMSPEQAAGSLDLDTRTDVYSLGVILYQLLTGTTPLDGLRLRSAAFDEVRRIIREEDPPKPSTRLSQTLSASPPHDRPSAQGSTRSTPPIRTPRTQDHRTRLRLVRGELDWIVMRALEKSPSRRYNSPEHLAADLDRYLAGEPVSAGPPSVAYRARKFVVRRKGLVAGGALMTLAAAIGVAGLGTGLARASRERDEALRSRKEAVEARRATEAEARKYRASTDFLKAMLSSAGPQGQTGREVTVREVLDAAAADLDGGALSRHPEVEATARLSIGLTYEYLGLIDLAELHLDRARTLRTSLSGPEHPDVAECLVALARLRSLRNDIVEAERLAAEAVRIYRATAPEHPDFWAALSVLATSLSLNSKPEEARETERLAVAAAVASHGEDSREAADMRLTAALNMHDGNVDPDDALKALDMFRRAFGPRHRSTAYAELSIGGVFHMLRRYDDAQDHYREALRINTDTLGPGNPSTIDALFRLAWLAESRRDLTTAEGLWRDVVDRTITTHGRASNFTIARLNRLAVCLQKSGRADEAEATFRQALAIYDPPDNLPPDMTLAVLLVNVGVYDERRDDWSALEAASRRLLSLPPSILPEEDWTRAQARCLLGASLGKQGRFAEGEPLLLNAYQHLIVHLTTKNADYPFACARRLETLYHDWNRADPSPERAAAAAAWKAKGDEHRASLLARKVPFNER